MDPIVDAIDFDLSEGMNDPSRASAIMRILPQLVGAKQEIRPIGNYSGLPQTGEQALADVAAGAGRLSQGMPDLGKIYQDRADMMQRGDVLANEGEQRRVNEENMMTRARAGQAMNVLKYVQEDRKIAESLRVNERLLAQDGRMRIEFIGNAAKAAGSPDSPEYRAYMDTFMRSLRDPVKRAALLDPKTGVQAMTSIMDEALQASRVPQTSPSPRTEAAIGVVGAQRPSEFPRVSPEEQATRDAGRRRILEEELAAETDPRNQAAIRSELSRMGGPVIAGPPSKPIPLPIPVRASGEGDAAYRNRVQAVDEKNQKALADYQDSLMKYETLTTQRAEAARKAEKEQAALQEQSIDARKLYEGATAQLSDVIKTAQELKAMPGLNRLVGPLDAWTPDLSPSVQNAKVIYENLIAKQVVDVLKGMKEQSKTGSTGFGALSDRELALVKNAAGKLARSQTEDQFRKHLDEYIAQLEKTLSGVKRDYESGPWAKGGLPPGVTVREK